MTGPIKLMPRFFISLLMAMEVSDTVAPAPELTARYEAQYQKFRAIYPAMKDLFPKLQ